MAKTKKANTTPVRLLTQHDLLTLLDYNDKTGVFRRKYREDEPATSHWNQRVGVPIPPLPTDWNKEGLGFLAFNLEGTKPKLARLAWKMAYGKDPPGPISYRDNNPENLKLNNLVLKPPARSAAFQAARKSSNWP